MSEQVPLDGTLLAASELPSTSITGSNPSIQQTQDIDGTVMTVDTENNNNTNNNNISNNNSDDHQYIQQERMIEDIANQIKQEQALTSEKLLLSSIQQQYRNNTNNNTGSTTAATTTDTNTTNTFITGLIELENTYSHIRTVRGDGNCYYRAFLYSLLEQLILLNNNNNTNHNNSSNSTTTSSSNDVLIKEGIRIYEYIKTKSWNDILQQNYDEMAIEIFHDEILDIFQKVMIDQVYNSTSNNTDSTSSNTISSSFHETMNEENSISDYCTWYLRLITATYIKQDPERFLPFIISLSYENNNDTTTMICDVNQFCIKYIEPMGQECEHVQVLALAEAFQIQVRIEYLDGRSITMSPSTTTNTSSNDTKGSSVYCHQFGPETSPIQITLLYRPGHYDILYKI